MSTPTLPAVGKTLRRLTLGKLPASARDFLRFTAYPNLVGRIVRQHPHIEVFASQRSRRAGEQLHDAIEQVNVNRATELCRIMKKLGSDKGLGKHNYTTVYRALFGEMRNNPVRVFELGIGTNNPDLPSSMGEDGKPGASLRGWSEFFSSGATSGADIDKAILFQTARIKTYYCDQLDPASIKAMWAKPTLKADFDIVIEDGLHTFEANTTFLESSIEKVSRGGFYIVEDIKLTDLPAWRDILRRKYAPGYQDFCFGLLTLPWRFNEFDNCLLVARHL